MPPSLIVLTTNSSTVGNQKHCFALLRYNMISVAEVQEKSKIKILFSIGI